MSASGWGILSEVDLGQVVVIGPPDAALAGCRAVDHLNLKTKPTQTFTADFGEGSSPCFTREKKSHQFGSVVVSTFSNLDHTSVSTICINSTFPNPLHMSVAAMRILQLLQSQKHLKCCVLATADQGKKGQGLVWTAFGDVSASLSTSALTNIQPASSTLAIQDPFVSLLVHLLRSANSFPCLLLITSGPRSTGHPRTDGTAEAILSLGNALAQCIAGVVFDDSLSLLPTTVYHSRSLDDNSLLFT
eukprot:c7058_g1_i1.p1 GENE.c7058_g1_i1~~c7058_g1_i1.p1  ORF type:complete len:256 (+),score=38.77 c7058_g1_i1:32-769(+)